MKNVRDSVWTPRSPSGNILNMHYQSQCWPPWTFIKRISILDYVITKMLSNFKCIGSILKVHLLNAPKTQFPSPSILRRFQRSNNEVANSSWNENIRWMCQFWRYYYFISLIEDVFFTIKCTSLFSLLDFLLFNNCEGFLSTCI